jgi:hypothetical protein
MDLFISPYLEHDTRHRKQMMGMRLPHAAKHKAPEPEKVEHLAVESLKDLPREKDSEVLYSNLAVNGASRFTYRISVTHGTPVQLAQGQVPTTKDHSPGFVRYYSPNTGSVRMMVWIDHHVYDPEKANDDWIDVHIFRGDVDPIARTVGRYDIASSTFRGTVAPSTRVTHLCEHDQVPKHGLTVEVFFNRD